MKSYDCWLLLIADCLDALIGESLGFNAKPVGYLPTTLAKIMSSI